MIDPGLVSPTDRAHLERARLLARNGWGHVHPNPMVGCVLVRDGTVVGEGYHREFGGPHAEVVALEAAREAARDATAYVSLEPCNHHGKTPPCSLALVQAGVRRVVYGAADPGAESAGGGNTLREHGVEVVGPVWTDAEARAENPAFFHNARHDTPFVALKLAVTLDGRISAAPGRRTRITGEEADRAVHRLRTGFDALMVGAGTARTDNPRLTVRLVPPGRTPPRRIVLAPSAELAEDAALLSDATEIPVHVFTGAHAQEAELERLEKAGAHVHPVDGGPGSLALESVLGVCRGLGIRSILCEGGARLGGALLREGMVRRLYLFIAATALGEGGVPAFGPDAGSLPWPTFRPALPPERYGRDTLIVLDRENT